MAAGSSEADESTISLAARARYGRVYYRGVQLERSLERSGLRLGPDGVESSGTLRGIPEVAG